MTKTAAISAFVLTAMVLPLVVSPYHATLIVTMFAYSIALLGLNLLFGYGGLLSLGHAMFMAIGAYSVAVLGTKLGVKSFELHLLIAVVVSGFLAAILGRLCARYATDLFSMLTLAFGMIFHSFLFKFYDLTGGETGISVMRPNLLGLTFARMNKTEFLTGPFYWYSLVLFLALFGLMVVIVKSPFGLALRASKDNARKTEFLGVHVLNVRYVAFMISAMYCAVGALS